MRQILSPRRWLLPLAIALAVFSVWTVWRVTRFRELAVAHGDMAELGVRISPTGQPEALLSSQQVAYHRRLEQKYLQASARPWWPVARDPREP